MSATDPYLSAGQTTKIDGTVLRSTTDPAPVPPPLGLATKATWFDPTIAANCPRPTIAGAVYVGS
jgi:hypothetical protein